MKNEYESRILSIDAQVSGCGGFDVLKKEFMYKSIESSECSERIIWQYDQDSQILRFLNKDAWLNCCGEHSIIVSMDKETGVFIIDEIDEPELSGGRCWCMCFFDFKVDLLNISLEKIEVELYRYITDREPRFIVWEGQLDLGKGYGDIVINVESGYCS